MLSDVLAALHEVKSQLQDRLARQPEYRALLAVDRAALQLAAVFDCDPETFAFSESRWAAEAPSTSEPGVAGGAKRSGWFDDPAMKTPGPSGERGRTADAERSRRSTAKGVAPRDEPADSPPEAIDGAPACPEQPIPANDMAAAPDSSLPPPYVVAPPISVVASARGAERAHDRASVPTIRTVVITDAPKLMVEISGMGAIYELAGEVAERRATEDGGAPRQTSAPAPVAIAGPTANALSRLDRDSDEPGAAAGAGGLTTALYESTGDAPDLDPPEERQMASAAQDVAQDEAAGDGAPALFDQTLAAAAKLASAPAARTASPGAKPTPPRSYLPIIAAQRLIQSRRF